MGEESSCALLFVSEKLYPQAVQHLSVNKSLVRFVIAIEWTPNTKFQSLRAISLVVIDPVSMLCT